MRGLEEMHLLENPFRVGMVVGFSGVGLMTHFSLRPKTPPTQGLQMGSSK